MFDLNKILDKCIMDCEKEILCETSFKSIARREYWQG